MPCMPRPENQEEWSTVTKEFRWECNGVKEPVSTYTSISGSMKVPSIVPLKKNLQTAMQDHQFTEIISEPLSGTLIAGSALWDKRICFTKRSFSTEII